jgi:hypothetical protein
MAPLKTAKFEKKLNRINYNLISNKPFPAITLRQMNLILSKYYWQKLAQQLLSVSFLRRQESLKKTINSEKPKIPTPPKLRDP